MSVWVKAILGLLGLVGVALAVTTLERPPVQVEQRGYRGTGMVQVTNLRLTPAKLAANQIPPEEDLQDPAGQPSSAVYQNVQVLKDVDANEFLRIMAAITTWVSPVQGCNYCHEEGNLASDALYTKIVARRMLQMTRNINAHWQTHVKATGVTCYTCHRGQPVPANIWFADTHQIGSNGMAQAPLGKDYPNAAVNLSSLPSDIFTPFLEDNTNIRVISTEALPGTSRKSIKQAEWTYGLMMHFSQSLGVNCTYCHNTRSFFAWDQSTPQRTTAWYGIRMVRNLNSAYLEPLTGQFPHYRLGALGDGPKLNCATCHQGINKPLYGVSMIKTYPELQSSDEPAPVLSDYNAPRQTQAAAERSVETTSQ